MTGELVAGAESRPHSEGSGYGLADYLHETITHCRLSVGRSPGSWAGFLLPTPDPVWDSSSLLGSLGNSALASAFFGNGVTEFVFSGKIRWRICFSLCPWKQMRRVKRRSVELRLIAPLSLGGQLPPSHTLPSQQSDTSRLRTWECDTWRMAHLYPWLSFLLPFSFKLYLSSLFLFFIIPGIQLLALMLRALCPGLIYAQLSRRPTSRRHPSSSPTPCTWKDAFAICFQ